MNAEELDVALSELVASFSLRLKALQADLGDSIEYIQRRVGPDVPKHIVAACYAKFEKDLEKASV